MNCGECGHTDGMHDEHGCVALDCSCAKYLPNILTPSAPEPAGLQRFVRPPRPPLNVPRYAR
jgi:hypothetical protein